MKRHVDLCCGVGTFSIALEEVGYETIVACDISPNCKGTYLANHRGKAVLWENDVFDIRQLPPCEVLTAGAPCQSFSMAGKMEGTSCKKNGGIFGCILRLIRDAPSRPDVVIFENVMGLMWMHKGKWMRDIEWELQSLGYDVRVQAVEAEQWGSPTARKRLFVVGRRKSLFPEEKEEFPTPPKTLEKGRIRDHLEHSNEQDSPWLAPQRFVVFPKEHWRTSEDGRIFVGHLLGRKIRGNGDPKCPSSHSQGAAIYHEDGLGPCITHNFFLVFVPDKGVRNLSVREVGSMMGLPRDFVYHGAKTHAVQMVANGISLFALRPVVAWALLDC
jgi:DNA (cytosine-5)-methyltransferase 1